MPHDRKYLSSWSPALKMLFAPPLVIVSVNSELYLLEVKVNVVDGSIRHLRTASCAELEKMRLTHYCPHKFGEDECNRKGKIKIDGTVQSLGTKLKSYFGDSGESHDFQLIYSGKVIEVTIHDYFQFDEKMETDPKGIFVGTWELVSVITQRAASAVDIEDKNVIFCSGIRPKKESKMIYYGKTGQVTVAQAGILQGDEFDFVAPHARIRLLVEVNTGHTGLI